MPPCVTSELTMAMKYFSCITFKQGFIFSIICLLLFIDFSSLHAQNSKHELNTVVLDAGHGGSDIGTPHYRLSMNEKDITLAIVLKLGKILHDSMPDLKVAYVRKTDVYYKPEKHHEIANKANGDLFISVHVNSTAWRRVNGRRVRETKAHGTMTFVLGLHRNPQKSKAIEDYRETVTNEPGMLDPNDPTTQILVAQYTQTFLSRSIDFASLVEQNFKKQGRHSYGVKQAGLEVLAGSAMPGVLIEVGFMNNPDDERYLNSESGQQQIAMSIYRAIKSYKAELNRKKSLSSSSNR